MLTPEQIESIAALAHEANRAYCAMDGDTSHRPWALTPDNIKQSAIAGVNHIVADPQTTPKQSHESWLAFKEADGWVYGPEKDAEKKTHPCMVPYEELSAHHRIKDTIFGSVVRGAIARYTGE